MDELLTKSEYTKMQLLDQWITQLIYPGKISEFIQEIEGHSEPGVEVYRRFVFYTEEHQYFIVAIDRENDGGYLGCQVQTRKPRAGEDWLRGNDLSDGPFDKDTWVDIINSIIRYEVVKLSKYVKPKGERSYDDSTRE